MASGLAGVAVSVLSGPLLDFGPDLVTTGIIFLAVVLLTWHGWWMRQHARAIRSEVQRRLDSARATQRLWIVSLIAFTGVFREGAETVLFLWGLLSQSSVGGGTGFAGAVLGVLTAAGLGVAIFRGGRQLSLRRFFAVTSVLLLLVSAGLFATGVGRLEAFGVIPASEPVWDTGGVLSDQSLVGSFLSGLVGYRARPSAVELTGYVAYLLAVGGLFFAPRATASVMQPPAGALRGDA